MRTPSPRGQTAAIVLVSLLPIRTQGFHVFFSIVLRADGAGVAPMHLRYSPYGEVRGRWNANQQMINGAAQDRHRFTGYQEEFVSKLLYAGARLYDPALGLFLTHDPARQFASPYAYGPGDPVNGTDPTRAIFGLDDLVVAIVLITAAAAAIDAGVRTGDVGAAFKAFAVTGAIGLATAAVGAYGLGVLKVAVSPATYATTVSALKVAGVAAGAYGTYQAANNGMYATAAVTAALTAFGAYDLLGQMWGGHAAPRAEWGLP